MTLHHHVTSKILYGLQSNSALSQLYCQEDASFASIRQCQIHRCSTTHVSASAKVKASFTVNFQEALGGGLRSCEMTNLSKVIVRSDVPHVGFSFMLQQLQTLE